MDGLRKWLIIGGLGCLTSLGLSSLPAPSQGAKSKAKGPVIAPGAPAFLVAIARKRSFAPCKTPPQNMVCIPGGIYIRGSNRNKNNSLWQLRAEYPKHYVILDTYYVDKYEVTHADFKRCLKANRCQPSRFRLYPGHWRYPRFGTPKRPFVSATWYHARDYCRFVGKRLLTEAEWEAAARGPKGYTYPWGDSKPDCKKANYRVFPPKFAYPSRPTMRFCPHPRSKDRKLLRQRQDQTWEVGLTPSYRGIYDMAGNGYEWVQDVYDPHAYAGCLKNDPSCVRINPRGPCGTKLKCTVKRERIWYWKKKYVRKGRRRVAQWYRKSVRLRRARSKTYSRHILKGGSWWWYADRMRAAYRRSSRPYTGMHRLSIRCASSSTTLNPLSAKPKPPVRRRRSRRRRP